jgi:hypothetical protein
MMTSPLAKNDPDRKNDTQEQNDHAADQNERFLCAVCRETNKVRGLRMSVRTAQRAHDARPPPAPPLTRHAHSRVYVAPTHTHTHTHILSLSLSCTLRADF